MWKRSGHKVSQERLDRRTKRHEFLPELGSAVMAKKKPVAVPPKLTEAEQDLILST